MATVHIVVCSVGNRAKTGSTMPLPEDVPIYADTITSSGTSQQSSIVAESGSWGAGGNTRFWCVTSTGNVWVNFGPNPTAAADSGWLVLAGVPAFFSVSANNQKIAVKDA